MRWTARTNSRSACPCRARPNASARRRTCCARSPRGHENLVGEGEAQCAHELAGTNRRQLARANQIAAGRRQGQCGADRADRRKIRLPEKSSDDQGGRRWADKAGADRGLKIPFALSVAPKARSRRAWRFDSARSASYAQRERGLYGLAAQLAHELSVILQLGDRVAHVAQGGVRGLLGEALGQFRRPAPRQFLDRGHVEIAVMEEPL